MTTFLVPNWTKVAVGTTNKAKIGAVQTVLPTIPIVPLSVPSDVSAQPFSDEETLQGAKNRAIHVLQAAADAEVGIGLEGGVQETEVGLFLCNWGALTDGQNTFIAGGARILLPIEFREPLRNGQELADLVDQYATRRDVRNQEGAMGILTEGWLKRRDVFAQIVQMLVGQYLHHHKGQ
ncbi:DUF84 family protein [Risungbinella massiliensis]|uniref:DUF84 family protein n=1 Tax=Risungbinella massiliensis TaxID=1329796 RepID=UPI0005CC1AA5|nr:DUF84 family protein [Risungbinella massiliensis]